MADSRNRSCNTCIRVCSWAKGQGERFSAGWTQAQTVETHVDAVLTKRGRPDADARRLPRRFLLLLNIV